MRCLILLIVIVLVYIASILELVNTQDYNFIMNFSILPLTAAVIFFSTSEALVLIVASFILTLSFKLLNVASANIIKTLLYILLSVGCGYYLKYITSEVFVWKEKTQAVLTEQHRWSSQLSNEAQKNKVSLEKAVHDISNLYQAPKKMISSIRLEELVDSLKKSIEGYFVFKRCKLFIFSFKEKEPKLDKVYTIPQEDIQAGSYDEPLIEMIKSKKETVIFDRNSDKAAPEPLALSEDIATFLAIPLIAGGRLNGIFAVEGLSTDDTIRFAILAHQFAMVVERIRLYELVQEMAITDGLTGIFVRRHFLERLKEEVERAKYFNTHLSFAMVDIDHFKKCNDRYGHLVGDVVLKEIAGIMKKNLREIDIIGRYGGEEFSIMLPDTSKEGAIIVGERLRRAVEGCRITAYDETINTTISIGITAFPDDTDEISQLIDKADQMLYKAKEEGRNRLMVYG